MADAVRNRLRTAFRGALLVAGLAIVYVLADFAIDLRPAGLRNSYLFEIANLEVDEARILRRDNLSIVVIRRSPETVMQLRQGIDSLQDPYSRHSSQPPYAVNPLRSSDPALFVALAIGTDLGCGLEIGPGWLREICGQAAYDFAGRALRGDRGYENLVVPDYDFDPRSETLTVRP